MTDAPGPSADPPALSIVVIGYRMSRQLANTLHTLAPPYQRGVTGAEYEIVLVENASDDPLDPAIPAGLPVRCRHVYRRDAGVSPAPAVNEGFRLARGEYVGIMVDGARMLTPGVVRNALDVFRIDRDAVVATLGYHLGERDQQELHPDEYDPVAEERLLAGLPRSGDGYRLFGISCPSLANPNGSLHPMMESNAMFVHRDNFLSIGGADERFDQIGGGVLNLDMYRELVELPNTRLYTLPGEGSFHQFHGGVTTRRDADRADLMEQFRQRYEQIRGKVFSAPTKEPQWFGEIPPEALPLLAESATRGLQRFIQRTSLDDVVWVDEVTHPREARELVAQLAARERGYAVARVEPTPRAVVPTPPDPAASPTAPRGRRPRLRLRRR